jgi:hypothetical protein
VEGTFSPPQKEKLFLEDDRLPVALQEAFEYYGLDSIGKNDQQLMLAILADIVFRKRGRPVKYTEARQREMGEQMLAITKDRTANLSAAAIARGLREHPDYQDIKQESLERFLRRGPEKSKRKTGNK